MHQYKVNITPRDLFALFLSHTTETHKYLKQMDPLCIAKTYNKQWLKKTHPFICFCSLFTPKLSQGAMGTVNTSIWLPDSDQCSWCFFFNKHNTDFSVIRLIGGSQSGLLHTTRMCKTQTYGGCSLFCGCDGDISLVMTVIRLWSYQLCNSLCSSLSNPLLCDFCCLSSIFQHCILNYGGLPELYWCSFV